MIHCQDNIKISVKLFLFIIFLNCNTNSESIIAQSIIADTIIFEKANSLKSSESTDHVQILIRFKDIKKPIELDISDFYLRDSCNNKYKLISFDSNIKINKKSQLLVLEIEDYKLNNSENLDKLKNMYLIYSDKINNNFIYSKQINKMKILHVKYVYPLVEGDKLEIIQ